MGSLRSRASSTVRSTRPPIDVRAWPHEPSIAHAVLLDVNARPARSEIERLSARIFADDPTIRAIRTSALFPAHRERFEEAGYQVSDRLALLERQVDRVERIDVAPPRDLRIRRLRPNRFGDAERIDIAAFPAGWSNSSASLGDIARATPRHHARLALLHDRPAGFAITGVAGPIGYLQRLAVDPDHQRLGVAATLVDDALAWLQRRGATSALVNTGVDNHAALELYRCHGFRRRSDDLVIMERRR